MQITSCPLKHNGEDNIGWDCFFMLWTLFFLNTTFRIKGDRYANFILTEYLIIEKVFLNQNELCLIRLLQPHVINELRFGHTDLFQGIGCLDGVYHIKIDPTVPPVVYSPRKIPFALKDKFKDELCRMEKIGVIDKDTEPSECVNSIVVIEKKNGNIRICLDPRAL